MQVLQEERPLSLPTPQMVELGQAGATPGEYVLSCNLAQCVPPGPIDVGAVPDPPRLLRGPTRVAFGLNDEHTALFSNKRAFAHHNHFPFSLYKGCFSTITAQRLTCGRLCSSSEPERATDGSPLHQPVNQDVRESITFFGCLRKYHFLWVQNCPLGVCMVC